MNYPALLEQVQAHVLSYFQEHTDERLHYHNRAHTRQVAAAAAEIARHYKLNDRDFFIVVTAAWFHDLGYFTDPLRHEAKGAEAAMDFLKDKEVETGVPEAIRQCILATRMPQQPMGLLDEVVCDADLYHLGTDGFAEGNKLLRREFRALYNKEISKEEWRGNTIRLLETHRYFTAYCRSLLDGKKQENLEKLKRKASGGKNRQPDTAAGPLPGGIKNVSGTAVPPAKEKKPNRPVRGIETMFRVVSGNHQRLSDMADRKAHIMISVNSIIISVLLSILLRKLDEYPHLTIPAFLLLSVNLVTIIFSILATRPTIPSGTFTADDIREKKVNLLFFGNFYRMTLADYRAGMLQMMEDADFLYGSLIRDVYAQGVVLGKKYRMLRASYNVFMYGLVGAVIAFVIASIIHASGTP